MAAIFQIRRGTTNETLTDGELYLHKGSGSIQFGSGSSNVITLLPLNVPVSANINLIGNITASNAYFTGDVAISGNLFLGNNSSDNISALGVFTSNLSAGTPNTYDIGSTTSVWRNVYATSISGAIAATNGVVSGSSQIVSILTSLNTFSGSQLTQNTALATISGSLISTASVNTISVTNLNTFSGSQLTQNTNLATISGSLISTASANTISLTNLNSFSGSQLSKDDTLATLTASYDGRFTTLATYTGSVETRFSTLATLTGSNSTRLTNLETTTASLNISVTNLNTFSGSQLTQNSALATITGSLISSASADRISIAELNSYTSSLKTAITASGGNVTINGNLTVKGTTTQIDSTTLNIGDNIIELNGASSANGGLLVKDTTGASGSLLWDSTLDYWKGGTLTNESKILLAGGDSVISSSAQLTQLNSFTGSQLTQNTNLATISGSLILTASANTISITNLNTFSSSQLSQNTALATISGSLISSASSDRVSITNINLTTASLNISVTNLNSFTSSQLTQNTTLSSYTGSVETRFGTLATLTGSNVIRLTNLETTSASLNISVTNLNTFSSSQLSKDATLATLTASYDGRFTTLGTYTASVNQTTSSLNSYTASISTSFGQFSSSYAADSASFDYRIDTLDPGNLSGNLLSIQQSTASLNTFSASAKISITNLEAATSSYETKGRSIVSSSAQITAFGFISSSAAIPSGTVSGSSQLTSSFDLRYLVTGSVTSSINALNTATSSYETKGRVIHSGSTGDYIFNSISVQNITGSASASFVSLAVNTTTPTQKIHLKGIVGIEAGATMGNTADQFVFGYVGSNLTNYTHKIQTGHDSQVHLNRMDFLLANSSNTWKTPLQLRPDIVYVSGSLIVTGSINGTINATNGVISGSSQILGASGIVSGSSQITYASISSIPSGIVSGAAQIPALLPSGVVSGSSQVLGGSGVASGSYETTGRSIVSSSAQIVPLLPAGVVSGSSQVITSNAITLGTHTTGNYVATIAGTTNQITVAGSGLETAAITLSTPQDIHSAATPSFAGLTINGAITATGDITAYYSDKRLKDISGNIDSALDKVNQISGVYYKQNELAETFGYTNYNQQVGVIAQEIQSVLPEAIALAPFDRDENGNSKSGENYLTVHYEKIVPLLIEAIKELSAKVKELENK